MHTLHGRASKREREKQTQYSSLGGWDKLEEYERNHGNPFQCSKICFVKREEEKKTAPHYVN